MAQAKPEKFREWFRLVVSGHQVIVGFAAAEDIKRANDGCEAHGVTWAEAGYVVLDSALQRDKTRLAVILLHELVHLGLGGAMCGGAVSKALFGAQTDEEHESREESVASYLSAQLAPALLEAGVLRLPALRRKAAR